MASGKKLLRKVLDDLCTRFVINIPDDEMEDPIRVFFVLEQAHWYYDDFYRKQHEDLPKKSLRDFSLMMFKHFKPFNHFAPQVDDIVQKFTKYKRSVPVCGALLLNPRCDKVLMVKAWGINKWGFPKGKVNEGEPVFECAVREVEEETGYNCGTLADPSVFIETKESKRPTTLFIVPGVPEDYPFAPQVRNEVSDIQFFKINKLLNAAVAEKQRITNVAVQVAARLKTWLKSSEGKAARCKALASVGLSPAADADGDDDDDADGENGAPPVPASLSELLQMLQKGGKKADAAGAAAVPQSSSPAPDGAALLQMLRSGGKQQQRDNTPAAGSEAAPGAGGSLSMADFRFDVGAVMREYAAVAGTSVR